jgi:hypothetical protein
VRIVEKSPVRRAFVIIMTRLSQIRGGRARKI